MEQHGLKCSFASYAGFIQCVLAALKQELSWSTDAFNLLTSISKGLQLSDYIHIQELDGVSLIGRQLCTGMRCKKNDLFLHMSKAC